MNKAMLLDLVSRSAKDDTIVEQFSTLIDEVEARLNERVRLRELMKQTSLTVNTDGTASLPSDFARVRFVTKANDPNSVLKERSWQDVLAGNDGFALGNGQILVHPAQNVDLHYWAKVPSLNSNDTNAVLDRAMMIYHSGIMAAWAALKGDVQTAQAMWSAFDNLITQLNANEDWALHGQQAII